MIEVSLKLPKEKLLEFCSKDCKNDIHAQCHAIWNGLGFEVICNCNCHKKNFEKNIVLGGCRKSSSTNNGLIIPNVEVAKYDY
jgi:hypothetical protein